METYDHIHLCTFNDLNDDFKSYVESLLKIGKIRGYGYWVWQTYIHKLILSKLNEGDIYHWCDIGCHFNIQIYHFDKNRCFKCFLLILLP